MDERLKAVRQIQAFVESGEWDDACEMAKKGRKLLDLGKGVKGLEMEFFPGWDGEVQVSFYYEKWFELSIIWEVDDSFTVFQEENEDCFLQGLSWDQMVKEVEDKLGWVV